MTVTERITALRKQMKEKGIDAYLVPTDDFHGSEYVGDYFKCQKIHHRIYRFCRNCRDHAGHGRTLDRRKIFYPGCSSSLEGTPVTLFKMGEPDVPTIHKFLEENLKEGMCLGFDGRTVSAEEADDARKNPSEKTGTFFCK